MNYSPSKTSRFSCQDDFLWTGCTGFSAELGCSLSGERARLSRGEPGSQLLGLPIAFRAEGVRFSLGLLFVELDWPGL